MWLREHQRPPARTNIRRFNRQPFDPYCGSDHPVLSVQRPHRSRNFRHHRRLTTTVTLRPPPRKIKYHSNARRYFVHTTIAPFPLHVHLYLVPSPMEWREYATHTRIRAGDRLRDSTQLESRRVSQQLRLRQHLVVFQITHADDFLATIDCAHTHISALRRAGEWSEGVGTHCTRRG